MVQTKGQHRRIGGFTVCLKLSFNNISLFNILGALSEKFSHFNLIQQHLTNVKSVLAVFVIVVLLMFSQKSGSVMLSNCVLSRPGHAFVILHLDI